MPGRELLPSSGMIFQTGLHVPLRLLPHWEAQIGGCRSKGQVLAPSSRAVSSCSGSPGAGCTPTPSCSSSREGQPRLLHLVEPMSAPHGVPTYPQRSPVGIMPLKIPAHSRNAHICAFAPRYTPEFPSNFPVCPQQLPLLSYHAPGSF